MMEERLQERLGDFTRSFPRVLGIEFLSSHPKVQYWVRMRGFDGAIGAQVVGEEESLPFAPGSFDAIVSCGTLHWANDLPGALVQCCRALRPDGLFLAIFPGGETLIELRTAWIEASLAQEGGAAPRISPFLDPRDAGGLLQRAGFSMPVADVERLNVKYPDARALMQDLRAMGEANALFARSRRPLKRATLGAVEEYAHRAFGMPDGYLPATFDLVTLTGWKTAG